MLNFWLYFFPPLNSLFAIHPFHPTPSRQNKTKQNLKSFEASSVEFSNLYDVRCSKEVLHLYTQ